MLMAIIFYVFLITNLLIVAYVILRRHCFNFIHFYMICAFFYTFTVPFGKVFWDNQPLDGIDWQIIIFKILCHLSFIIGFSTISETYQQKPLPSSRDNNNIINLAHPSKWGFILSAIVFVTIYLWGIINVFGSITEYLQLFRADRMNIETNTFNKLLIGLRSIVPAAIAFYYWTLTKKSHFLMVCMFLVALMLLEGNRNPLFFIAILALFFYERNIQKIKSRTLIVTGIILITVMSSYKVLYYYYTFFSQDYSVTEYITIAATQNQDNPFRLDNVEFKASYWTERFIFEDPDYGNGSYITNTLLLLVPKQFVDRTATLEHRMASRISSNTSSGIRYGYSGPAEAFDNFSFFGFVVYAIFGIFVALALKLRLPLVLKNLITIVTVFFLFNLMRSSFGASVKEGVFLLISFGIFHFLLGFMSLITSPKSSTKKLRVN